MNMVTCNFNQYESDLTIHVSLHQLKLHVFQLSLHHECDQVNYQESSTGFDNLACLQSIERGVKYVTCL